jgi:anti-anti-sigma factor
MDVFESKKDGILTLALKGRLDAVSAPSFRDRIMNFIDDQKEYRILLECSNMDYVSSAGIRVLFEVIFKLQDLSGKLGCYGVTGNVRKIFGLADLTSELGLFASQEEALKNI